MLAHLEEVQIETIATSSSSYRSSNSSSASDSYKDGVHEEVDESRHDHMTPSTPSQSKASSSSSSSSSTHNSSSIDDSTKRLAMLPEHSQLLFPPSPDDYFMRTVVNMPSTSSSSGGSSSSGSSNSSKQRSHAKSKTDIDDDIDTHAADADDNINHDHDHNSDDLMINTTTNNDNNNNDNHVKTTFRSKTWPVLQCDNIFVLPGIPQFFASKMHLIVKYFIQKNKKLEIRKIVLDLEERLLVSVLDVLVVEHRDVKIGSYPFVDHPEFKTIISIEGIVAQQVEDAVASLIDKLPSKMVVLRVEKESGVDIE